jgi:hypothetical protein
MTKKSNEYLHEKIMWMLRDTPGETPIQKINNLVKEISRLKSRLAASHSTKLIPS